MFGIGMGEVFLILVVVLLVYGPDRLPEMARKAGRVVREFRKITDEVQAAVRQEIDRVDIPEAPQIKKAADTQPAPQQLTLKVPEKKPHG